MKGQKVRYTLGNSTFEGETSCEFHISIETEESYNKDNADNCSYPVMVGYSFDGSIECQVVNFSKSDAYGVLPSDLNIGEAVSLKLTNLPSSLAIATGSFIPTSISYKADNKKTVTASIKLEGTGELTV